LLRIATAWVIAGQLISGAPIFAQDTARVAVKAGSKAIANAERHIAKARVRVNRTVPKVTPPSIDPMFGMNVTTATLMKARVFPEQLIPTSEPSADDNAALARILERIAIAKPERRGSIIDEHIQDRPTSPWRASLLANAGTLYAREGYFSRAQAYWTQAWELTRNSDDRKVRVVADFALGESVEQMTKFGQVEKLEARLKEAEGRDFRGPAGTKVADAREGLNLLKNKHHLAIFSGPEALKMYLTVRPIDNLDFAVRTIAEYHPSMAGTTMTELRDLAASAGLKLMMWRASSIEEFPVPAIVHLRSQHFSTIVEYKDGRYRLRDPGLGGDMWLSAEALRDETTGFVMTSARMSRDEWRAVSDGEGRAAVGHCTPGKPTSDDPPPGSPGCDNPGPGSPPTMGGGEGGGGTSGGGGGATGPGQSGGGAGGAGGGPPPKPPCPDAPAEPGGMPYYRFHPSAAGLVIDDVPLGYVPAVGPSIGLQLSYNHRNYKTPSTFGYGHVGPLWTFSGLSYVVDNNTSALPPYTTTWVYLRGHGRELYTPSDSVYPISHAELVEVTHDPAHYERRLPNGAVEVFTLADRASSLAGRRIFLTERTDPEGHSLTYDYDSSFHLIAITDTLGQVTTFEYEHTSDPDLLTKVTDPFGRFATLGYDAHGRLSTITDVAGMTSTFSYGASDFIVAMTTPYGTTTFRQDSDPFTLNRMIEATDPVGGRERLEFHFEDNALPASLSSADVPTGFGASNADLNMWNSFYWNKLAMARHPGDITKAVNFNWMMASDGAYGHGMGRPILHSSQRPGESRVWYRYPGQSATNAHSLGGTTTIRPALIGRILDGGGSQVSSFAYNANGQITSRTDPAGRQTTFTYAINGLDLLHVEQVRSGGTDVIASFSDYTSQHLAQVLIDAAGNDSEVIYSAFGQPLTITNAKNETTTITYEGNTQNLLTVTGPVSGATKTFTYDAYNRVESVESSDGYVVEFAYDSLNRVVSRTYPDATTETLIYNKLDLVEIKDRLGRITKNFYDGYGRLVATRDPAGRTLSYVWCTCGTLDAIVDAKGQRTSWERDINGRITREIRADGATDTVYTYDTVGRLSTNTDPMDQVTTFTYNIDDSLASTGFTNETIATPDISHTYDTYYPRALTMVDGNGTTTYSYVAAGTNGAGRLASVDGPFSNDTINYTYDELGRVLTRTLNGTGTEITYDTLGRLLQLEFPIGTFDYTYLGHTGRRSTVTYPNNQSTIYSYLDDEHDFRLESIHHKNPSAATLSKSDYSYDVTGNILTWRQERAGSAAKLYTFTHDLVDQLTSAILTDTSTPATTLKRQAWAYDSAGNRTVDQTDDAVFATMHDEMNRLQSRAPGGQIVFAGSLNEAGTVTIDGKPVSVNASNNFSGTAQLGAGTTTVTVKAKDASGNETTQQYEVEASGNTTSYTYDANGNLTSDGTKTYFWNALNELVEVKQGSTTLATFEYDGFGRRTEKAASGITRVFIYDTEDIVEERLSGSTTDTIRYYHGAGIDEPLARTNGSSVTTYYLADHLGSILQETTSSGSVALDREYDASGRLLAGNSSGFAFTGREWDSETELYYYRARYYDPSLGRFDSEDPLGFGAGQNFYAYVLNNPAKFRDPFGLDVLMCLRQMHGIPSWLLKVPHPVIYSTEAKKGWGFGPAGTQLPGLPDQGHVGVENPFDPNNKDKYSCSTVSTSSCVESCVQKKATAATTNPPSIYMTGPEFMGSYQCTDWADDIMASCQAQCKK